jgi:hypothetical protein
MPYLNVQGLHPKIGAPFAAMLDDGHSRTSLPVTGELTSQHWLKIGENVFRQVLSCRFENGTTYFGITPSRLGVAEQQRARRVSEAVQAGRALRKALDKLDDGDKGRARMLDRQLQRWLETAQAAPARTRADDGEMAHD